MYRFPVFQLIFCAFFFQMVYQLWTQTYLEQQRKTCKEMARVERETLAVHLFKIIVEIASKIFEKRIVHKLQETILETLIMLTTVWVES